MRLTILLAVALGFLSGCATHNEPGWQGNDAHPFGTADSICRSEADASSQVERDMVYRSCMMRHGWTRPPTQTQAQ